MTAFHKNTSLKQLIGTNTIKKQPQIFSTYTNNNHRSMYPIYPCYTTQSLCSQQVLEKTFTSTQTKENFTNLQNTKIKIEKKIKFLDKETWNFNTIWLKPRTWLIPCYAVPIMFTLHCPFGIGTKNLTHTSQLTSNNIISCCKSDLQLCPLKTSIFIYIHTYIHTYIHMYYICIVCMTVEWDW